VRWNNFGHWNFFHMFCIADFIWCYWARSRGFATLVSFLLPSLLLWVYVRFSIMDLFNRYGFGAYFTILPGTEWSAIMLTYGFPLSIIGMALKVCSLCSLVIFLTIMSLRKWNVSDNCKITEKIDFCIRVTHFFLWVFGMVNCFSPWGWVLLPLQYAELKPVPCLSYSDAVKLRESCATPILTQVRSGSGYSRLTGVPSIWF